MMFDSNFLESPIVLTGCQRSGTTLLRTMLGNHPALLEHPDEPQFILGVYNRQGKVIRNVATAVSHITNHPYTPKTFSAQLFLETVQSYSQPTLKNLIQAYVNVWAGNCLKRKRPLLKDPAFIFNLPLVAYLFPQVKIIHIVRDPRGNVSSQITRWAQISIWEAATMWKTAVTTGRRWGILNPTQYLEVNYENLVQDPTATLKTICHFLQVPYIDNLLRFEQKSVQSKLQGIAKKTNRDAIDPTRLLAWQNKLSSIEVKLIEKCCGETMQTWQYTPLNPDVPNIPYLFRLMQERVYYALKMGGKFIKATYRRLFWRLGWKK